MVDTTWLERAVTRNVRQGDIEEARRLADLSLPFEQTRTPLIAALLQNPQQDADEIRRLADDQPA